MHGAYVFDLVVLFPPSQLTLLTSNTVDHQSCSKSCFTHQWKRRCHVLS